MPADSTLPVTVRFFGICTHFGADSMPPLEPPITWYHRVVLVNASDPDSYRPASPHLDDVGPHKARLQLRKDDLVGELQVAPWFPITYYDGVIVEWALDGVILTMAEADPAPEPSGMASCIPSLTKPLLGLPLVPGPRAYETNRAGTACFFDFDPVVVQPEVLKGGAVIAAIDVSSSKAPELVVTSFDGATLRIPLQPGAEISVSNIPDDPKVDKDLDFILHYLAVNLFPADPWHPTEGFENCAKPLQSKRNLPRNLPLLTTPGCSDSNYP